MENDPGDNVLMGYVGGIVVILLDSVILSRYSRKWS